MVSAANATGSAWKLPPEMTSLSSREDERVVGDAVRLHSEGCGRLPKDIEHRAHDLRLAAHGIGVLHAVVARRDATPGCALPAMSARKAAATSICPRWPAKFMDARIEGAVRAPDGVGRERAGHESRLEDALGLEQPGEGKRRRDLRAVEQGEAFFGAERQRLEARRAARACAAGIRSPSTRNAPTPIRAAVIWARGARSPDAAAEPWPGMTGARPWRRHAARRSTVDQRTPEAPWARLASFSAIVRRTTGPGRGSPTPAACDRTRLRCKVARSTVAMRTPASLPKPVVTP